MRKTSIPFVTVFLISFIVMLSFEFAEAQQCSVLNSPKLSITGVFKL